MSILAKSYQLFFKPIAFRMDPEVVHDLIVRMGMFLGMFGFTRWIVKKLFTYKSPVLAQDILGLHFDNPIGLAAGFDKDGQLTNILPSVGFAFAEIGSVTGEACAGNPKPRLWRLKHSQSLLVYYGLKNRGAAVVSNELAKKKFTFILGVSVAKTNSPDTIAEQDGIDDYVKAYRAFIEKGVGDYYTINISCPNAYGGEPFVEPAKLDRLLSAITQVSNTKPIFLKMPAELDGHILDSIIELARKYKLAGFISTNLAKDRSNSNIHDTDFSKNGGMSGKVVQELSDKQIEYIYKKTKGEFIIIGCGGVFTAEDAYKKIKLGASLIQMITGMVYQGPQVIGEINKELAELLVKDGYGNVSEAIGVDVKK